MNPNNPSINEMHSAANSIRHLTADQLEELLTLAMRTDARDHALFVTAWAHAMRASEVSNLRLSDLNWQSLEITINRVKGSLRTVQQIFSHRGKPCLDETRALKKWLAIRSQMNEPTDFVFSSQKGGSLHPDCVNRLFKQYVATVNDARRQRGAQPIAEGASVHWLKHTRVTLALDAGVDFYKVALLAGHKAISSTLRYAHGSQVLACREISAKDYETFN